MSKGRAAKRARQKARRDARREAMVEAVRRRRRQRSFVLVGSVLLLVGIGTVLAFLAFQDEESATMAPTPEVKEVEVAAPVKQPVACGAELPEAAGSSKQMYSAPEDAGLDPDTTYLLRLETSCGKIDIALDVERSPETTNSVAFLASQGYYDGLVFHRIVPGFVAQGGDPSGDGTGGPGYSVVEAPPDEAGYTRGVVAMAKGGSDPPGSSGSQFFIVTGEDASLPPQYAVLGEVVAGDDVLEEVAAVGAGGPGGEQPPTEWVYIERATLIEGAGGDEG